MLHSHGDALNFAMTHGAAPFRMAVRVLTVLCGTPLLTGFFERAFSSQSSF